MAAFPYFSLKTHYRVDDVTCENVGTDKEITSRKSLNKKFATNPKHVYRSMKGSNIIATKIPEKADVEEFWKKPESTKTITDNEIRSQEAPRDNIKEQLM